MMDILSIPDESQDPTEINVQIKDYDHKNIPKDADLTLNIAKTWEEDWRNYAQGMLVEKVEKIFIEEEIGGDAMTKQCLKMTNETDELKKVDAIDSEKTEGYMEKVQNIEARLQNVKIRIYGEHYPEIVEAQKKEVLKAWFDPDSDRRDGEFYWGRFTIKSKGGLIDLTAPSEKIVNEITDKVQELFPGGIKVRVCTKSPTYETNTELNDWNSYLKGERTFPVFISYVSE